MRVLLIGLMASGKTTVGLAVAARLGCPYIDNDEVVEELAGAAKDTLVEREGEAGLRAAESAALRELTGRPGPFVAGVAAGVVLDPDNVVLLAGLPDDTPVVWLRARVETLADRIAADPQDRPWLTGDLKDAVARLAADREPFYAEVADVVVDVDSGTPAENAEDVLAALCAVVMTGEDGSLRHDHTPRRRGRDPLLGSLGRAAPSPTSVRCRSVTDSPRPDVPADLARLRASIDNIDAALVHLLAERFKFTQAVGALKARQGLPPADPSREAEQIARLREMAKDAGLDPVFAEKFLAFIVEEVIRHHLLIAENHNGGS